MKIIAVKTLRLFWEHPASRDAEQPLKAWYAVAKEADWARPADVKRDYGGASIIKNNRVVFNVAGNKYRFVVSIYYPGRIMFVKFVGSHGEYDKVDAETVEYKP
jgi:mRNA interferase HigB